MQQYMFHVCVLHTASAKGRIEPTRSVFNLLLMLRLLIIIQVFCFCSLVLLLLAGLLATAGSRFRVHLRTATSCRRSNAVTHRTFLRFSRFFFFPPHRQRTTVTLNGIVLGARMQTTTQGSRETLSDVTRSYCGREGLPLTLSKSDIGFLFANEAIIAHWSPQGSLWACCGVVTGSLWGHYGLKLGLQCCSAWECSRRKALLYAIYT